MPEIIPAITLWQPWASLIAVGAKPYETRGRPAPVRLIGKRIAIHAAKRPITLVGLDRETVDAMMAVLPRIYDLPLGAVVCTAILTESLRADELAGDLFGDYGGGRWAWRLTDVVSMDPVPARGQRLWGWPWVPPEGFVMPL